MGIGDVRSYTADSPVNTPNIDRIANAGMQFTNAHSSSSVCSPTRYSLLTGRYAWRTSLQSGVVTPHAPSLIEPSSLTVGEMLQDSGYSTAAIGKWHLGMNWATSGGSPLPNGTNVDYTQPFTNGPTAHGFDTYVGDDIINWPPYTWIRDDRTVGSDLHTPAVPVGSTGTNTTPYTPPGGNQPGLVTTGYNLRDVMPTITNQAVSYIASRAAEPNPFFLYFSLTAPHEPIFPPDFLQGTSGVTGAKQAYGDFIATVDWSVGRVLDTLMDPNGDEDTSDSIVDNTLIVFAADNGAESGPAFSTSPGMIGMTPMRGDKHTIYEGGHRVPLIAQWNNHIPAGTTNEQLVELNDFMATVAEFIGYDLPRDAAPDSVSIAPQLLGQSSALPRNRGVNHSFGGAFAFRQFDERGKEWKLIFSSGDGVSVFGKVDPMSNISNFGLLQLYNLTDDPGEQTNLLSGGGTTEMQQRALAMQTTLQDFISSGQSTPLGLIEGEDREIRIDVGADTQRTLATGWNNLTGAPNSVPEVNFELVDTLGDPTGINFATDWSFDSASDAGIAFPAANYDGPYPAEIGSLPMSALRDNAYVRDGSTLTMTLSNLDPNATYDFLIYGAAGNTGDYSLFTAAGANSGQDHITPLVENSDLVAEIPGITPNESAVITLLFEGRRPDGSPQLPGALDDALGRLNFIRILERLVPVPGDFNNDRLVNAADYDVWRATFGSTSELAADANGDGVVDAADYVVWRRAATAGAASELASSQATGAVPEPAAAIMLLSGLLVGLPTVSRRHRSEVASR